MSSHGSPHPAEKCLSVRPSGPEEPPQNSQQYDNHRRAAKVPQTAQTHSSQALPDEASLTTGGTSTGWPPCWVWLFQLQR